MAVIARQLAVVFVSNNTMAPPLQPWLMRTFVAMAEGREAEPTPSVSLAELEVDADAVAGRYRIPGASDVHIIAGQDGPAMQTDEGPEYHLYHVGYGVLCAPGLGAYLSFEGTGDDAQRTLLWTSVFTRAGGPRLQR